MDPASREGQRRAPRSRRRSGNIARAGNVDGDDGACDDDDAVLAHCRRLRPGRLFRRDRPCQRKWRGGLLKRLQILHSRAARHAHYRQVSYGRVHHALDRRACHCHVPRARHRRVSRRHARHRQVSCRHARHRQVSCRQVSCRRALHRQVSGRRALHRQVSHCHRQVSHRRARHRQVSRRPRHARRQARHARHQALHRQTRHVRRVRRQVRRFQTRRRARRRTNAERVLYFLVASQY